MWAEIPAEELAAALDAVAGDALHQAGASDAPVDAVGVAKALGLAVAWDDRQAGRARRVVMARSSFGGGGASASILLRHDLRPEREQWAVAHEIGESLAERVFWQVGLDARDAPPQAREQIANCLAGRLLLPRDGFAADAAACNWDLLTLKEKYATASHELIARRMLDFSIPVMVGVYDQNRVTWRKSNCGGAGKPSALEIECRRQAYESGEVVWRSGPPAIRAWPIHEAAWKREVVRVELDEFG